MADQVNEAIDTTTDSDNLFLDGLNEGETETLGETGELETNDQLEDNLETQADEEVNQENETDEVSKETFLEVRYHGKTQKVTKVEAVALAQKGMNYDSIYAENVRLNEIDVELKALADEAGINPNDYLKQMASLQHQSLINQAAMKIKEQYPDTSDELVLQVAKGQVEKYKESRKAKTNIDDSTQNVRQKLLADIERIEGEFEGYNFNELPEAVVEEMKKGLSLYEAVIRNENGKLIEVNKKNEEKEKAKVKNLSNAQKTTGKIEQKSTGPASADDLFLTGFNS